MSESTAIRVDRYITEHSSIWVSIPQGKDPQEYLNELQQKQQEGEADFFYDFDEWCEHADGKGWKILPCHPILLKAVSSIQVFRIRMPRLRRSTRLRIQRARVVDNEIFVEEIVV